MAIFSTLLTSSNNRVAVAAAAAGCLLRFKWFWFRSQAIASATATLCIQFKVTLFPLPSGGKRGTGGTNQPRVWSKLYPKSELGPHLFYTQRVFQNLPPRDQLYTAH